MMTATEAGRNVRHYHHAIVFFQDYTNLDDHISQTSISFKFIHTEYALFVPCMKYSKTFGFETVKIFNLYK